MGRDSPVGRPQSKGTSGSGTWTGLLPHKDYTADCPFCQGPFCESTRQNPGPPQSGVPRLTFWQLGIWGNPGQAYCHLPSPHRAHSAVTLSYRRPVLPPSLTLSFTLRQPSFRDRPPCYAGVVVVNRQGWVRWVTPRLSPRVGANLYPPQMVPRCSGIPPDSQLSSSAAVKLPQPLM